jgi:putative SOS response-associated peptidase YedK
MCFTIEVHLTRKAIEERFSVDTSALYDFDFNYFYRAFTNPMIPVIAGDSSHTVRLMQWGLIPSWVKNRQKAREIQKGTYNARADSLHEKPSFREPLLKGRCLVLANGFFEWQHVKGAKIPWFIRLKNEAPFAFAGLYDSWRDPDMGEIIHTFTIITTEANPLMERIHNTKKRMPVILTPDNEKHWISGDISLYKARQLLLPLDENEMSAHMVSPAFTKAGADPTDSSVIKPFDYQEPGFLF